MIEASWENRQYKRLKLGLEGPDLAVLVIELFNPDQKNALDDRMQVELLDVLEAVKQDSAIRCVIFGTKAGADFCSGGDIAMFEDMSPQKGAWYSLERGQHFQELIRSIPKPVICAVDGWCLAGGTELVLMCDFAFATEQAKFGLPEINLGLLPGWGGTVRLTRAAGLRRAKELIFTGDTISAQEAHDMGILNRVCTDHASLRKAIAVLCQKICSKSQHAIGVAKQVLNDGHLQADDRTALAIERGGNGLLLSTGDFKARVSAFLNKTHGQSV